MKKLFSLVTLAGLGLSTFGCAGEKPKAPTPPVTDNKPAPEGDKTPAPEGGAAPAADEKK